MSTYDTLQELEIDLGTPLERMLQHQHHSIEDEEREPLEPSCSVCGCTNARACPGGCVWYGANLCSRCVREEAPPEEPEEKFG